MMHEKRAWWYDLSRFGPVIYGRSNQIYGKYASNGEEGVCFPNLDNYRRATERRMGDYTSCFFDLITH